MRLELTRIGNSRGVRIPKPIIEQCGLHDLVEARVSPEGLVLSPYRAPRHGWEQAFSVSNAPEERLVLEQVAPNTFDIEEWRW